MSFNRRSALPSVLVVLSAAVACATPPERAADPFRSSGRQQEEGVLLTVENNDYRDATIYAYWNGVKARVGMVIGKTARTFEMRWRSEELRLEVDFIGGGGHMTERIGVWDGDHLNYVIMPSGR